MLFFYPLTLFLIVTIGFLPHLLLFIFNPFFTTSPLLPTLKNFFSPSKPCFYVFFIYNRFCSHKPQALAIHLPRQPIFFILHTHFLDPLSIF